jgi:hypothetical protein
MIGSQVEQGAFQQGGTGPIGVDLTGVLLDAPKKGRYAPAAEALQGFPLGKVIFVATL